MKYKTLIEKNAEPNLTEGRLTTPPHTPALPAPLSSPLFPLPPTHPTKVHLRWPRRSRGAWKKRMRREYNWSMWYQNMWMSEQLSCCCSCSFSCSMVSLELVVLSPSYIFLTEVVLTRRFHFFCAVDYTHANDAKVERIESYAALEENCYIWKHYLAEIDKKRKAAEVSHTENRRIYRKSSNKAFSASRVKFRMQISGCERVTWLRISTPEIFLSSCAVSLVLPATFIWSCHNFNKLSRFQFFYMND